MGIFDWATGKEGWLPDTKKYIGDFERWTKTGISIGDIITPIPKTNSTTKPTTSFLGGGLDVLIKPEHKGKSLDQMGKEWFDTDPMGIKSIWTAPKWVVGGLGGWAEDVQNVPTWLLGEETPETGGLIPDAVDAGKKAAGDIMPDWSQFVPDWSQFVPDWSTMIPEGFGDMSGIGEGIAVGMGSMGAQLAQALSGFGEVDTAITDEEGNLNIVVVATLAVVGIGGIYLIKKG